jgi:RNA polymerase sigma-70 factor (ECF subfamily)
MVIFPFVDTGKFNDLSDQQLLEKFYDRQENEWLGILLQRYTLLLLGVCMKYMKNEEEAKDCVQHIFLKVIEELHKYKVEYFKSWLYMVAKNHCLMKLRYKQGKTSTEIETQTIAAPEEVNKNELEETDHILDLMEGSLQELNNEQQQCVTLFYLHKKSYQQISEETGFTMMQVKSHIQNGKRNLKILIERKIKNGTR